MLFDKLFGSREDRRSTRRRHQPPVAGNRTQKTRKLNQKIDVADLRVGMFVVQLDIPWEESTFMLQGVEVNSTADIAEIKKQCKYVYVDYDEFSLRKTVVAKGLPAARSALPQGVERLVEDEFDDARQVHALASQTLKSLFTEVRLGGEINSGKVKQAVNGCVDSILRNPDASVWLTRIQAKDQSTAQHSLNVTAFSIMVGKALELSPRELEDVGVCAMLHDVGKTSISDDLLQKPGPLTDEEITEMRKHTTYGRDILVATAGVLSGAADVALTHHEREDGTGYPRGLAADEIPLLAKIVSIAEAYDVMTTRQPYRHAVSPSDALQELYALRGKQFDENLVIKFIDAVGIFPPGSIVEMTNGEVGIVLSNTTDKLRPRVIMILDDKQEPTAQAVVDLSQMDLDTDGRAYQIKSTHRDGAFGIDVGDFQRAGLRMG